MRAIPVVCMLMVLGASSAGAVGIKGKWGIGAGVFGGGGELSLIRGKSERSAWLVDVFATQRYDSRDPELTPPAPSPSTTQRLFAMTAGPGYRRFTRPTEAFSPYWDVRLRGTYTRISFSSGTNDYRREAGLRGDFSIGLEYFTKWHFSVAAHTGVAQLVWFDVNQRQSVPGNELRITGSSAVASVGLAPVLFVRGYF